MKYETILAMPDSKEKFNKLENKLLELQHHGAMYYKALDEYNRLYKLYRGAKQIRNDAGSGG